MRCGLEGITARIQSHDGDLKRWVNEKTMLKQLTPSSSRSYNMSRIRSRDTKPECLVRSMIHRWGYRFRLHCRELPGKPDIVLVKHRKIIFVHGCFWHAHGCRVGGKGPKTNRRYWNPKLQQNRERDKRHLRELRQAGWLVLVVWECWTRKPQVLEERLRAFLALKRRDN